ncbi:hypothetical protein WA171_003224 [Blastocystis sp. BT1]
MSSSSENGDKQRVRNRRVSFDYAPSVIDIQMNSPPILTIRRRPSHVNELSIEQLYEEAQRLKLITRKDSLGEKPKKKHHKKNSKHTSGSLGESNSEASDTDPFVFSKEDFVCECSDEELRRMVSNVWRDSMLERMNLVGLEYTAESFDNTNLEEVYNLFKEVTYPYT